MIHIATDLEEKHEGYLSSFVSGNDKELNIDCPVRARLASFPWLSFNTTNTAGQYVLYFVCSVYYITSYCIVLYCILPS